MKNNCFSSLKSKADIENLLQHGKSVKNGTFKIVYQTNNLDQCRFAIGPGKKNFKSAVLRNRIKRQMREIVKNNSNIIANDIFVVIYPSFINNTFEQNKNLFLSLYNVIK
jgi:ribonuclease P protein component